MVPTPVRSDTAVPAVPAVSEPETPVLCNAAHTPLTVEPSTPSPKQSAVETPKDAKAVGADDEKPQTLPHGMTKRKAMGCLNFIHLFM